MLTWSDILAREDAVYFSEAIEQARAGAITPAQVAHLLAGGILRDDIEVEAYDKWEVTQEGDWAYADRYTQR